MVGRSGYFRPMSENISNLQYEYLKNVLIMSVRINRNIVKYISKIKQKSQHLTCWLFVYLANSAL